MPEDAAESGRAVAQSSDLIDRLKCWLFGHDWGHLPDAIPEDRDTYRCCRCGTWTMDPPDLGDPQVPEDQLADKTSTATEYGGLDDEDGSDHGVEHEPGTWGAKSDVPCENCEDGVYYRILGLREDTEYIGGEHFECPNCGDGAYLRVEYREVDDGE